MMEEARNFSWKKFEYQLIKASLEDIEDLELRSKILQLFELEETEHGYVNVFVQNNLNRDGNLIKVSEIRAIKQTLFPHGEGNSVETLHSEITSGVIPINSLLMAYLEIKLTANYEELSRTSLKEHVVRNGKAYDEYVEAYSTKEKVAFSTIREIRMFIRAMEFWFRKHLDDDIKFEVEETTNNAVKRIVVMTVKDLLACIKLMHEEDLCDLKKEGFAHILLGSEEILKTYRFGSNTEKYVAGEISNIAFKRRIGAKIAGLRECAESEEKRIDRLATAKAKAMASKKVKIARENASQGEKQVEAVLAKAGITRTDENTALIEECLVKSIKEIAKSENITSCSRKAISKTILALGLERKFSTKNGEEIRLAEMLDDLSKLEIGLIEESLLKAKKDKRTESQLVIRVYIFMIEHSKRCGKNMKPAKGNKNLNLNFLRSQVM